jgi:hypothetical protein
MYMLNKLKGYPIRNAETPCNLKALFIVILDYMPMKKIDQACFDLKIK